MGAVAGTEVASIVSCVCDRYAAKVRTHSNQDQPLWIGDALVVVLSMTQNRNVNATYLINLTLRAMPNEQGLTLPLENGVFALGDAGKVDLDLRQSKDIRCGPHGRDKLRDGVLGAVGGNHAHASDDDVGGGASSMPIRVLVGVAGVAVSVVIETGDLEVSVAIAGLDDSWRKWHITVKTARAQ